MMKEMAEAQCRVYQKEGVWVGCVWGIQSMIQRIAIKVCQYSIKLNLYV